MMWRRVYCTYVISEKSQVGKGPAEDVVDDDQSGIAVRADHVGCMY